MTNMRFLALLGLALLALLSLFFLVVLSSHPGSVGSLRRSVTEFWNTVNKGGDPFLLVYSENMKGLETLLKSYPELSREMRDGYTPLHVVHTIEGARILLDNGAEIDVPTGTGTDGLPPLHDQIMRQHTDIALLLIDRGANVTALDLLGRSPLHMAAKLGDVDVAYALLKKGADPEKPDGEGRRVVDYLKADEPYIQGDRSAKRDKILKFLDEFKK